MRAARTAAVVLAFCLGGLTGCGDRVLETGFGWDYFFQEVQEPPPSPIRRIGAPGETYPSLSGVPARPYPPIATGTKQLFLDRLAATNRSAHLAGEVLQEDAPPLPPPDQRPAGQPNPEPVAPATPTVR